MIFKDLLSKTTQILKNMKYVLIINMYDFRLVLDNKLEIQ